MGGSGGREGGGGGWGWGGGRGVGCCCVGEEGGLEDCVLGDCV